MARLEGLQDQTGRGRCNDLWLLAAPLVVALAAGTLFATAGPGVFDDDAYIFFRYARNLVAHGEFAYNPSEPSFGFTSPAWLLLLAGLSGLTGWDPLVSAKVAGVAGHLAATALVWVVGRRLARRPVPATLAAVLFSISPVVLRNAVSGMETSLHLTVFLGLLAIESGEPFRGRNLAAGLLLGAAPWVRPEGIVLLPAWLAWRTARELVARGLAGPDRTRRPGRALAAGLLAASLLLAPFTAFWMTHTGRPFPSTYQAKMLGHSPDWEQPSQLAFLRLRGDGIVRFFMRLTRDSGESPAAGLLLLGLLGSSVPIAAGLTRRRLTPLMLAYLAVALLVTAYMLAYPSPAERYYVWLLPVAILALVYAWHDGWELFAAQAPPERLKAIGRWRAGLGALLLAAALPVWAGTLGPSYQDARQTASQEPIATLAPWFEQHIPAGETYATDMIGLLSYVVDRPIFDLGGLIHEEIRPALAEDRDRDMALDLLRARGVRYLVTFSDHILWNHLGTRAGRDLVLVASRATRPLKSRGVFSIYWIKPEPGPSAGGDRAAPQPGRIGPRKLGPPAGPLRRGTSPRS